MFVTFVINKNKVLELLFFYNFFIFGEFYKKIIYKQKIYFVLQLIVWNQTIFVGNTILCIK